MIEFELDLQALGRTVFAFSPLAELASSLRLLGTAAPNPVHRPWLGDVAHRLQKVDMGLLRQVHPGDAKWSPSFLYPPVSSPRTTIEEQLSVLAQLSADELAVDLTNLWPDSVWPPPLRRLLNGGPDAGKQLAAELHEYWLAAIAPYWVRMAGVLEEDVSYRATQSLHRGLFALLAELHPRITLAGDRLAFDLPAHADASYSQARLTLVPSVFGWPGLVLTHERPGEFEVTYGARGTARVWEGLDHASRDGRTLEALLGRTRSTILQMLAVPRSTTELARELHQSPASISSHVTTLRDSGLATCWRAGRVVLYQQTPLATSLVELNQIDLPHLHQRPWPQLAPGDAQR